MPRPITLFTGQWADLPLEEVARLASEWGYDGLELACWGDHFEVDKALDDDGYVQRRHDLLDKYGLKVWAISNHLVGQAVCDHPIDERHKGILPARIWGDGAPEGVRQRAAEDMKATARAAARARREDRHRLHRVVDLVAEQADACGQTHVRCGRSPACPFCRPICADRSPLVVSVSPPSGARAGFARAGCKPTIAGNTKIGVGAEAGSPGRGRLGRRHNGDRQT
jgi:hypothetical protein